MLTELQTPSRGGELCTGYCLGSQDQRSLPGARVWAAQSPHPSSGGSVPTRQLRGPGEQAPDRGSQDTEQPFLVAAASVPQRGAECYTLTMTLRIALQGARAHPFPQRWQTLRLGKCSFAHAPQ